MCLLGLGFSAEVTPGGTPREGEAWEEVEESTGSSQEVPGRWPLAKPGRSVTQSEGLVERPCAWHRAGPEDTAVESSESSSPCSSPEKAGEHSVLAHVAKLPFGSH